MKIERFEDMEIWKEARELSKAIYLLSSKGSFEKDYRFRDQIRSAAGSIMDNTAEGFGRGGNKEFINFLSISKGSCEEVRSQAYRAADFGYINTDELNLLLGSTNTIARKINNLISYLKSSTHKGPKYHINTPNPEQPEP
jgi:four helix bundle protein